MKKRVPKILSLVLCVIMAMSFAACAQPVRNSKPETSVPDGQKVNLGAKNDWVAGLFAEEKNENKAGEHKNNGWGGSITSDRDWLVAPGDGMAVAEEPAGDFKADGAIPEKDLWVFDGSEQNGISAGTLTAGKTDDNVGYAAFIEAIKQLKCDSRQFGIEHRIAVTVPGVNNAKVALVDQEGNVMATARTNVGGVAYLYYNLRGEDRVPYMVGVSKGEAFEEVTLEDGQTEVAVSLSAEEAEISLDMMIMLDTTGSMGDELEYIKAELKDMINRISTAAKVTDIRLSVNFYRDHGDDYTVRYYEFTENIDTCIEYLAKEYANGGGDYPEAVDEALINGVTEHAWREDAVKVMFMVLDAPAHEESERQGVNNNLRNAVVSAASKGVRIVPVVASGANDDLECTMRKAAAVSGGKYIFLTNHSGIGLDHKDPVDVESDIYPLNDLMVDVVLEYLDAEHQPLQGRSPHMENDWNKQ